MTAPIGSSPLERLLCIAAMAICTILIIATLCSCAGWQHAATKTVLGVESGGKAARAFLAGPCSAMEMKAATDTCIAAKDAECAPLKRCETAHKALHGLFTATLVAKLTIQAGDEAKAGAAVTAALQAIPAVVRSVEVWK